MTKLIIDGDPICHLSCRYDRWQSKVKREQETLLIKLNNAGEKERLEYTKEEDRKYMEESWKNFQNFIVTLQDQFFTEEYVMAVAGKNNFRLDVWPDYKVNRRRQREKHPDNRQRFVKAITQLSIKEGYAIPADGREADDMVRIWAEQCRAMGEDYVVVTIDKDLKCIPGKFYDPKLKKTFEVTEEEALQFYYRQLIEGDTTDGIPGVPGVGTVGSDNAVKGVYDEETLQEIVANLYYTAYYDEEDEDAWFDMLELNGQLIHIQKTMDDKFTAKDWPFVKQLRS